MYMGIFFLKIDDAGLIPFSFPTFPIASFVGLERGVVQWKTS